MERDITISVSGTAGIIAFLFWLAHRRIKPMLWLLTLLALILAGTLALGGLIFGAINVVSMGFAAILLGLAVDYAVVHYQEALAHPNLTIPQIRRAIAPSIFWAAVTTISAFLVLNFGGLTGLGQLGTLVGLGVALAACIMIFEFLPPLFPERREMRGESAVPTSEISAPVLTRPLNPTRCWVVFSVTAGVLLLTAGILLTGMPRIDPTANALRPRHSLAYAAMEEIQTRLTQQREPLWLIVGGHDESEVAQRLKNAQSVLARAQSNRLIAGFNLPTALWPNPGFQTSNRPIAANLLAHRNLFAQTAKDAGFAENSLGLANGVFDTWQTAVEKPGIFWPTNAMSEWIFQKFAVHGSNKLFALGLVKMAATNSTTALAQLRGFESELPRQNAWLSGWALLGDAIFSRVKANLWKVLAPMILLVLLSLGLAFRRPAEILLSVGVLIMSGLCLLAMMRLAGWSWNLLNLMAIPLILGTGVDYSIFMQLALKRYGGDLTMAYRSVGRALLLCGGTAIAGFGSLAWSSNAGMASLGQVCAVGIACNMLIAIFLLPVWWDVTSPKQPSTGHRT